MLVKLQIFLLIAFTFQSCIDFTKNDTALMDRYSLPDIDSLIQNQSHVLDGRKVLKNVVLDGEEEELTIDADSSFWASELSVFTGLEINKPSLVGAYEKIQSGNTEVIFRRKIGEKKGAIGLTVISASNQNIMKISGATSEQNALYTSEQKLMMVFDQNSGLLTNYSFSGFQKLIIGDTTFFEINGTVQ